MKSLLKIPLLLALFGVYELNARIITVHPGTADALQQGYEQCGEGDTLLIKAGTYSVQKWVINKRIIVLGEDYPVLDGDGDDILIVRAHGTVVKGLHLQNVGVSHVRDQSAILLDNCIGCRVEGNRLINTFFGIYLRNTRLCTIRDNVIEGHSGQEVHAGNAIHAWQADSIRIINNRVSGHRDGIYFEFVNNSRIDNNVSFNNLRYGLHFMFSNNDIYRHNTFSNNGAGVAVMFSKHIEMTDNHFTKNRGSASYGLLLKEINDGVITNNRFTENSIGLYAEGANRIHIENNSFNRNGKALDIKGNCLDLYFTRNNVTGNLLDLVTNSKSNNNIFIENYWDNYSGYDLDRDGYGDVPYRPVKLFSVINSRVPATTILMRSLLIELLNHTESVVPAFTPEGLTDDKPLMKPVSL